MRVRKRMVPAALAAAAAVELEAVPSSSALRRRDDRGEEMYTGATGGRAGRRQQGQRVSGRDGARRRTASVRDARDTPGAGGLRKRHRHAESRARHSLVAASSSSFGRVGCIRGVKAPACASGS